MPRRSIRSTLTLLALTTSVLVPAGTPSLAQSAQGSQGSQGSQSDASVEVLRDRLADAERQLAELTRQLEERDTNATVWEARTLPGSAALASLGLFASARIGITLDTEPRPKDEAKGAVIREVVPEGPAARAGVEAGDVVTAWNGKKLEAKERDFFGRVSYNDHLLDLARRLDPGDRVELEVLRDGKRRTFEVIAEKAPPIGVRSAFVQPRAQLDAARALENARVAVQPKWNLVWGLGGGSLWGDVELVPVDADLGEYFQTDRGLLVLKTPEGDAFGLRAGDVIESIGEREPRDATHALRILRSYDSGEEVNLHVVRKGERITLSAEVPESEPGGFAQTLVQGYDRNAL